MIKERKLQEAQGIKCSEFLRERWLVKCRADRPTSYSSKGRFATKTSWYWHSLYEMGKLLVLTSLALIGFIIMAGHSVTRAGDEINGGQVSTYIPLVNRNSSGSIPQGVRQVNAPYFPNELVFDETAIFWFGKVTPTENYADVRVGYTRQELFVHVAIFDRLLWYDATPPVENLTAWDAVTLFLNRDAYQGSAPTVQSFRFIGQLSWHENRANYQAAYQGDGSGWKSKNLPFTTEAGLRGSANDLDRDSGWRLTFHIPFTSLGLDTPPAQGSIWGMGVIVHDRDDSSGTVIPDKSWPESVEGDRPASWGRLAFGLPALRESGQAPQGSLTIRQGLNGAIVPDGEVGGATNCGDGMDKFTEWGEANYAGIDRVNVQNQYDVSDSACFSKYYITFPLDRIPKGKEILNARLVIYQFGNAGGGEWGEAPGSWIQVFTVGENWDEATLTWNNAPLAMENVSRAWVPWLADYPGAEGLPREWGPLLQALLVSQRHRSGAILLSARNNAPGNCDRQPG